MTSETISELHSFDANESWETISFGFSHNAGHLTAKSDVYSFGVVLLEVLSGRRAVDKNRASGEQNLVEWAKPYLGNKRKMFRILDSRLEGQYTVEDAYRASTLALRCLSLESRFRPTMSEVVKVLEEIQQGKEPGDVQSNERHTHRVRRKSADDLSHRNVDDVNRRRSSTAYPRPSASPLYAWQHLPALLNPRFYLCIAILLTLF